MKNLKKYFTAVLISGLLFTSCDDPERREAQREFDEFKAYVSTNGERFDNDDDNLEWEDYDSEWKEYDRGYMEHVTTIEDKRDFLSEENQKEFDRIQTDYDRMRTRYETRATEEANANRDSEISKNMYATVGITDPNNMSMENVSDTNYNKSYTKFVTYVEQNRNNFNQRDWENADRINEAFKNRRNAVGNTKVVQDNTEVKKMETKYTEMRSTDKNTTSSTTNNTGTNNTGTNNNNTGTNNTNTNQR